MAGELARLPAAAPGVDPAMGSDRISLQLILLSFAVWASFYARAALGPLQETMSNTLALSDHQIAVLQGPATALATIAGSIPIGLLVDRYSRARLMCVFAALSLGGSALTALSSDFLVLCMARWFVTLAGVGLFIGAFSLIADLYAPAQRGRATMIVTGGADLAPPAAFAFGGLLLVQFGGTADDWRWAMLWMTAPPLIVVTLLMLKLREPVRTHCTTKNPRVRDTLPELWQHRHKVMPLLAARCMVALADVATLVWAAPFLARKFELAPDRIGAIMGTGLLIASLTATICGGLLADFCHRVGGPRRTILALSGLALLSLPASLFGVASTATSSSVLLIIFLTLGLMTNMAGGALALVIIPNELRGVSLSVTMVAGALIGGTIAPLLVSMISDALGGPSMVGQALAIVCAASSALGTVTFAFGSRYLRGNAPV